VITQWLAILRVNTLLGFAREDAAALCAEFAVGIEELGQRALEPLEQIFSEYSFVDGYGLEDTVQGADTERSMCWNHDPVVTWHLGLENDMAADLMDKRISPQTAKVAG